MTAGRIDFDAVRAANPILDTVGRYVELTKRGSEYKARCPFHGDRNPSLAVVPRKGKAFCNACGWHGDVLDFVAEFEGIEIGEAAKKLQGGDLPAERPRLPDLPDESAEWLPILPVPADAPAFNPAEVYNPRRGKRVDWSRIAKRQDAYLDATGRLLGYVMRLEIDGEKLTPAVTFCANHRDGDQQPRWASVKFPEPRPLQGLDELAARPQAPVLVVSGEKCRAAGAALLTGFVTVTWPGGDNGVSKAAWAPLAGRSATLWPDADPSGIAACGAIAELLAGMPGTTVRMLDPADLVAEFGKGADLADLVAAGWNARRIIEWAKPRVTTWEKPVFGSVPAQTGTGEVTSQPAPDAGKSNSSGKPAGAATEEEAASPGGQETAPAPPPPADQRTRNDAPSATPVSRETSPAPPAVAEPEPEPEPSAAYSHLTSWSALGLQLSDKGVPNANLDNAARLLEKHPDVAGNFWFDEFQQRIYTSWGASPIDPEPREWSDADDVRLALWMQRKMGIGRMAVGTARDAVTAVAMAHRRNECREWLESLTWDGLVRLPTFLAHAFGAVEDDYSRAVGRCFVMGLAARVLDPGCKVDNMPVFEGPQGLLKSTALRLLVGNRWFAEASKKPTDKDFFLELAGKLLVEIGEMAAFSTSEKETIKRMLSCMVDRYRPPYGRRAQDFPRQGAFAGTTNHDDWNRDETGARRFWPVACTRVDLAWVAAHRDQLFAEAVARFRRGESWWDVPKADAEREQEARREGDEWEPVIASWLLMAGPEVRIGEVLKGALRVDEAEWDMPLQKRIARCLRVLGWERGHSRKGKVWRRCDDGTGHTGHTGHDQIL